MIKPKTVEEGSDLATVRALCRHGAARSIRIEAHLSLREVASICGVTDVGVSRWERGLRVPHGAPALAYAALLRRLSESV